MRKVTALALKDVRLLLRDRAGFFFTFFFPFIIAVFFGSIFSGSGGGSHSIPILVVDEDQTEQSEAFIVTLESADELRVTRTTRDEAVQAVRKGKSTAYIALTPGFGAARKNIFWGDPPKIELGVDPARRAEAGMLQGILMKYAVEGFQEVFTDTSQMQSNIGDVLTSIENSDDQNKEELSHLQHFMTELDTFISAEETRKTTSADPESEEEESGMQGFQPLVIEKSDVTVERAGPKNAYAVSFPQGIIWGIMGCAAAFGISLVVERTNGTLVRLLMSPVSRLQILTGKALACFITTMAISVTLLLFAIIVFKIQPGSVPLLMMAIVCISMGFVGIMMLLSVLGKTEQAAGGIGWAILLMMAMFGGGMIPLFIMPSWMQNISHISPVKWAILAMEGAIWRQFTFVEMLVPCGILLAVGLVSFLIGVRAFRWSTTG